MSRILVIDTDLAGIAFCKRCVEAGHSVRYYLKPKPENNAKAGMGFKIERVSNWVPSAKWADLVFVTHNDDYLKRLDFFRSQGVMVFGPTAASADLEIKRSVGMKFLEDNDIDVPPYETFKDLKAAEAYVRKHEERYVFKTLGDNEDKSLSYCSKSPADMISRLQLWQKRGIALKGEVMLQTFIEGIEMGVSRWMGSDGFIGMFNENFEHKNLMAGGSGPNTGEMGTVMKYTEQSNLGEDVLTPLENSLMELGNLGDVDVNCIIDAKGKPWPLEFTVRPGWPAFNIMMSEHKGDPAQWMLDACQGNDTLEVSQDVAVGVLISIPPFPNAADSHEETEGLPIYGITKNNQKYIYPMEVMIDSQPDMNGDGVTDKDIWTTAGEYVAVVTGMGRTVKQASQRCYKTVDQVHVADKMYRNDIGEKLKESLPTLHEFGYATSFKYGDKS